LALTLSEREEISRGIAVHRSARSMAGLLGRSPSTVSREISRNGGYDAYERLWRMTRPGPEPVAGNAVSWRQCVVATGSGQQAEINWAPEQIAGWLKELI